MGYQRLIVQSTRLYSFQKALLMKSYRRRLSMGRFPKKILMEYCIVVDEFKEPIRPLHDLMTEVMDTIHRPGSLEFDLGRHEQRVIPIVTFYRR